jgi:hypothetical protein
MGLELFDAAPTLGALLPKIVRSYALDAYDYGSHGPGRQGCNVERFLGDVAELNVQEYSAVGLGMDVRMEGRGMAGAGLLVDERYVHLSVISDAGPEA